MVVDINKTWKVPVGYFFIDGLSGEERANLATVCIKKLHDVGVDVISLICDKPSCHLAMLRTLGACMTLPNLKPYFIHPSDKGKKIYVLDICHMLKLVRNTLGDGGILVDKDGKKSLLGVYYRITTTTRKEGLRLSNKLKLAHIRWWQQKMKVNLAAQTFSASVADAIEYCTNTLKLDQFQGSEATVRFLRTFDHLFDILNSRNPCAKGFKAALRKSNVQSKLGIFPFMTLMITPGDLMYTTRRKTGFIGFMVAIESMKGIFAELVEREEAPMMYILTYKFSQDHLELFFGATRSSGGFNNNPTAQQFTAAYKRLLSCKVVSMLEVTGDTVATKDHHQVTINDAAIIRKYDLQGNSQQHDDDYSNAPTISTISEFKKATISYIAGYVVGMVQKR